MADNIASVGITVPTTAAVIGFGGSVVRGCMVTVEKNTITDNSQLRKSNNNNNSQAWQ